MPVRPELLKSKFKHLTTSLLTQVDPHILSLTQLIKLLHSNRVIRAFKCVTSVLRALDGQLYIASDQKNFQVTHAMCVILSLQTGGPEKAPYYYAILDN